MTEESKGISPWKQAIAAAKGKFQEIVASDSAISYERESMFAMQQIVRNDQLLRTAMQNPTSVRNAVINVAATGLSLNPALKFAYLVPRDGEVCLDISYVGLIKIATDTGSILWAKAEIVYENDTFIYNGPCAMPTHQTNPFSKDRGAKVGVYCIAKTRDGEILVETLSADDVEGIRKKSKGADSKYSPWQKDNFEGEMWKKSVIKRASKTWPKTDRSKQFDEAVQIINAHEGLKEEYIGNGKFQTISEKPVDSLEIESMAQLCREIIDEDDPDTAPMRLAEIQEGLTNDELIDLMRMLKASSPEGQRKTYGSLFNDYVKAYKESIIEPVVEI
ncbi:MAG: recombinase RecT [bacterium]